MQAYCLICENCLLPCGLKDRLSLLNLDSCGKKPEAALEEAILSRVADGIIVSSAFVTARMERLLLKHDFPQICIGEPQFDTILSWIDANNTLSSNLAVEHLVMVPTAIRLLVQMIPSGGTGSSRRAAADWNIASTSGGLCSGARRGYAKIIQPCLYTRNKWSV